MSMNRSINLLRYDISNLTNKNMFGKSRNTNNNLFKRKYTYK